MNRSRIEKVLLWACLALFSDVPLCGAEAPSLMIGGDFEAGTGDIPTGWTASLWPGSKPADGTMRRSTERVRSGQWAFRLDTGPVVGQDLSLIFNGAVSEAALTLGGQRVVLSGWVFVEPNTALRPIHMRLRTFGPDEQGQGAFLGDVLETTVLGEPGAWTEFRASGTVPHRQMTGMDLHCGIGADVVPTIQFLDDVRLEVVSPPPVAFRPLRRWLWRDEAVVPVSVEVNDEGLRGKPLALHLLDAHGQQVAAWEREAGTGVIGLSLPAPPLPEGRYTLRVEVSGGEAKAGVPEEATLELVDSPWEGTAPARAAADAAERLTSDADFTALGTIAPTGAADATPEQPEPESRDVDLTPWQDRGYVVFTRHYLEHPSRLGRPRPGELGPVRLFASPGEYEPAVVAVWALRDQERVVVTVSDLEGDQQVIGADCVDVRSVRSPRGLPEFLEQRAAVSIPQGQTHTFWLTLHVPRKTRPGLYRGRIVVQPAQGQGTEVGLLVRVLPLTLPPPQRGYGFWWAMDGRWRGYYSDQHDTALEQIRRQFTMLRDHGCNMVSCPLMPKMTRGADGTTTYDFTRDHWEHCLFSLAEFVHLGQETGFFSSEQPIQYTGAESLHSGWIARQFGLDHESSDFDRFFREACSRVDQWAKQQGLTFAFACVDEIGNGVDRQREALRFYRQARDAGVLTSVTDNSMHGGVHLMGQPRFDDIIAMRVYNFITPEMLDNTRASGDRLWLYNLGSTGWSPKLDRFVFGLFTERCGAEGYAQWAFQWPGSGTDPYQAAQEGKSAGWHYALPAPDGPLPTLALEAVREGIDDARYLALLKDVAPEHPEASLEDIEPLSPRIGTYLDVHDADAFDVRRWRIARAAMGPGG